MRLYHAYGSTKFEANRSKNTATVAKKPPKWTFLRHNVATLLRHDVQSSIVRCAFTMCMSPPNLKQIRRKTRLQWPKNRQNGRFNVITSRRHYVMTNFFVCYKAPIPYACLYQIWSKSVEKHGHSGPKTPKMARNWRFYVITSRRRYVVTSFFTWYDAPIPCPCLYQIWSKSVEKHGHSGPKTPKMAQNGRFYVITSRRRCVIKISTPSLHPPYPPLHPVQVSWRSIERSRSLSCCKKVVVVVVGGRGHQMNGPFPACFRGPLEGGAVGAKIFLAETYRGGPSHPPKT